MEGKRKKVRSRQRKWVRCCLEESRERLDLKFHFLHIPSLKFKRRERERERLVEKTKKRENN